MSKITLPKLLGDGAVIQREKPIHIWGWVEDKSGVEVAISFAGKEAKAVSNGDGFFETYLDAMTAGGPYELKVVCGTDEAVSTDIYMGDVFHFAGQSNIEFPMYRVRDTYPEEFDHIDNKMIHEFKIKEHAEFVAPIEEHDTAKWSCVNPDSFPMMSVLGYFTSKHLTENTGVHVGFLNTTLGGTSIETWMSKEMLEGYDDILAETEPFKDPEYVKSVIAENERVSKDYYPLLDSKDRGLAESWMKADTNTDDWKELEIPLFFKDHEELKGFIGTVWLKKKINVSSSLVGKETLLWFGVMADSDIIYVNGEQVGTTPYVYPPRRYTIPAGLLHEGENDITIRLRVERGYGKITPGKLYGILSNRGKRVMRDCFYEEVEGVDEVLKLDGTWMYKIGTTMPKPADTVFVNWRPTALYNGMIYPCFKHAVRGIVWYQGESNCGRYDIYHDEFTKMISGFRKSWNDDTIPVYFVQLPNFIDYLYEGPGDVIPEESYWVKMQRTQEECLDVPYSHMIKAIGYGEDNDLHPQSKEPIARKIAEYILEDMNK